MRIEFEEEAEFEIDETHNWYEFQKTGLGKVFIAYLNTELEFIKEFPQASGYIYKTLRKHVLKKYPYNIYYFYSEKDSLINVIGLIHHSRNPKVWKKRIT